MKSKLLLTLMLIGTILLNYSCSATKKFAKTNPDVSTFIGSWVGESRTDGTLTTWLQKRFADGTYTILFIQINDNEVVRNIESGKWWIENGKFYEISSNVMEKPDIFEYRIVSGDLISFKSTTVDYQFVDKRIEENYFDKIPLY
ncbi:MAG TPA: hypothetical protein PLI30_03265 [Petrimonas sp.]|nr:hypothetical protein [Petrimonas sp.]